MRNSKPQTVAKLTKLTILGLPNFTFMAGINPDFFKNEFHFQIEQLGLGEHLPGDTEHSVRGAEVQAAAYVVFPLFNAFVGGIHGVAPCTSGNSRCH